MSMFVENLMEMFDSKMPDEVKELKEKVALLEARIANLEKLRMTDASLPEGKMSGGQHLK